MLTVGNAGVKKTQQPTAQEARGQWLEWSPGRNRSDSWESHLPWSHDVTSLRSPPWAITGRDDQVRMRRPVLPIISLPDMRGVATACSSQHLIQPRICTTLVVSHAISWSSLFLNSGRVSFYTYSQLQNWYCLFSAREIVCMERLIALISFLIFCTFWNVCFLCDYI